MNIWSKFIVHLFVLTLAFSACSPAAVQPGQVEAIQAGTSLWVIQQVLKVPPAPNSFMIGKDGIVMFATPMQSSGGWGSVVLNVKSEMPLLEWSVCSGGTGTFYKCGDMASLISKAMERGYKFMAKDALPATFMRDIMNATSWISTVPLTILVLPIEASEIPYSILPEPGVLE